MQATGRSAAKAILMGEHFVVHGAPAMAVPIQALTMNVTLSDASTGAAIPGHLGVCVRSALTACGVESGRCVVAVVASTIPVGAGLGSSAALSIAVARAAAALSGAPLSQGEIREISMSCEREAHGRPSGIDTEVCLTERPVWVTPDRAFSTLDGPGLGKVGLVVLHTSPGGATAEMIRRVSRYRDAHGDRFRQLAIQTQDRTLRARERLLAGDADALGALLCEQHEVLQEIGVSTPLLDAAVNAALAAGATGAKLSGAGGGGVVVAVGPLAALESIRERLESVGHKALSVGPVSGGASSVESA